MNNEPVAWIRSGDDQLSLVKGEDDGYMFWKPLYTHPAKTLTDEEIFNLEKQAYNLAMQVQNQLAEIDALKKYIQEKYDQRCEAILRKAQEK